MAKTLTTTSIAVTINGKDYKKHVMFPFKVSNLLDEQLDEASLTLIGVPEKNFKPLTDVIVTLKNGDKTQSYSMLVASDKADEIPTGSGRYKHELYLIEQTKYLECFIVRSVGFVNSLQKEYTTIEVKPEVIELWENFYFATVGGTVLSPSIQTPVYVGEEIKIPALNEFYTTEYHYNGRPKISIEDCDINFDNGKYYCSEITIRNSNAEIIQNWRLTEEEQEGDEDKPTVGGIFDTPPTFIVPQTSTLTIEYQIVFIQILQNGTESATNCKRFLYYIAVL